MWNFSKEMKTTKENKMISLEMKITRSEMKNSFHGVNSRPENTQEIKTEDKSIEIIQTEAKRGEKEKKRTEQLNPVGQH